MYQVIVSRPAKKFLDSLSTELKQRITLKLIELESNPRPRGVVKLEGEEQAYRIRIGNYRVIYEIHDKQLIVHVIEIAHRRESYR